MKILITAATEIELSALPELPTSATAVVTGVGIMETTYHFTRILAKEKFDLVLNIGLCGTLSDDVEIGSVVQVERETIADLGAEDDIQFIDIFELYLRQPDVFPFQDKWMHNPLTLPGLKSVKGVSVNKVTGSEASADFIKTRWGADIETMEAAAVFYTCLMEQQDFHCLRAVSNKVERRNRQEWKAELALDNLKKYLTDFFKNLQVG